MGNDVRSQRAVQKFLQRISQEGEPVVIAFDEIHALPKHIQTGLLTLLNDRVYSYMDENGVNHNLPIKEFTFYRRDYGRTGRAFHDQGQMQ